MRILKKISADQLFKVSFIYCFLQILKYPEHLHLCKRSFTLIQPVSQNIKTVHQSLWIRGEVCLTVTEFKIIDSRFHCFFINSILNNISKHLSDHRYELFFSVRIRSLCDHCKIWLENSVIIRAIDILSQLCIQKRLFQRCSRCT